MEQTRSYGKFKAIALFAIFITALIAGTFILLTRFVFRPRATAGIPRLNFSVLNTSDATQADKPYDLILKVNPNGAAFYAFELYFTYDPTKIELQSGSAAENISSNFLIASSSVNTTTGEVSIVGARTGTPFSGTDNQEIARLKVKVKEGATGEYKYEWKNNTKLGNNLNVDLEHLSFVIGNAESASLYLNIPIVIPSPSPGAGEVSRGANLDTQIYLKTQSSVKSVDVVLPYDPSRLSFQNTSDLNQNIVVNPDSGFNTQFVLKNIDKTAKKITIAFVASSLNLTPIPVRGGIDIHLATITFRVNDDAPFGETMLMIDGSSKVYNMQTQNIFTSPGGFGFTIVDLATITKPVSITGDPAPYLINLKLKLQGILTKPAEEFNKLKMKVSVVPPNGSKFETSEVADFVAHESGVWSGSVKIPPLTAYGGKGFKLFVKGPKHIQKRICIDTPQESFPGTYHCENGQIELQPGTNDLDFSGIYLLVGDLPQQDGVVNSYDVSLVRNNIGSKEPAILALADLNLDGIVDTQDYSLVIAALSVRSDEGE